MMSTQCMDCKNHYGGDYCKAFDGEDDHGEIPEEIYTGQFTHDKKHPDQKNNVLFAPFPESQE